MLNKQLAIESFNLILWKARRDSLLAKLMRRASCLKRFEEATNGQALQKRFWSVIAIPTEKITGTVERIDDFDGRFRPLKKHLRDRWVSVAVQAGGVGWPPIEVYKVGEEYFVIDGHHRTSYARNHGIAFIDAKVWELVQVPVQDENVDTAVVPTPIMNPIPIPAGPMCGPKPTACCP